jgi:hypothetical protein
MSAATEPAEVFMQNARYFWPHFDQKFSVSLTDLRNNTQDQISLKSVKWEKR